MPRFCGEAASSALHLLRRRCGDVNQGSSLIIAHRPFVNTYVVKDFRARGSGERLTSVAGVVGTDRGVWSRCAF
jgi:hypothetical protein